MTDAGGGTDGEEPESEERAAARDRSDDESSAAPRLASPPPELGSEAGRERFWEATVTPSSVSCTRGCRRGCNGVHQSSQAEQRSGNRPFLSGLAEGLFLHPRGQARRPKQATKHQEFAWTGAGQPW
uniref:Uncharacterized protein n=1 Tax=Oryza nivara TaxID=4536 RepID=A0A0E0IJY7_ORYNI